MGTPNPGSPTGLELEILKILWDCSPMTVREIRDTLDETAGRPLAHTTVITMLSTMVDKQQIEKLAPIQGKAFRFAPLVQRNDVSGNMVGDLVERVFDGSAEALMQRLFDVRDLDEKELTRLRKLVNQKLKESRS